MTSTIARRLSTLASFYRYCHSEQLIGRNPAANIRRPRVDYESRTLGLDRNELGALVVEAGLGSARDGALITLLAMNGLRISEALNADIEHLSVERGHRTLAIVRKGGKHVTVTIAPRTSRALDLYIADRTTGADLPRRQRRQDGPLRGGPDGQAAREAGRDRQADLTAQPAAFVHHRCPGRRCPVARRPRSRQPRRPQNNDALRPCPTQPRPTRHLHRLHFHCRRDTLCMITAAGRYRAPIPPGTAGYVRSTS
jgi:hypothetical protein